MAWRFLKSSLIGVLKGFSQSTIMMESLSFNLLCELGQIDFRIADVSVLRFKFNLQLFG